MINTEYCEAITEVLEIINHLEENDKLKIPNEIISFYEKNKSKTYIPNINFEEEDFSKLNIHNKTREILAGIYIDYLCTNEDEKKSYIDKLKKIEYNYEENKKQNFDPDTIFKKEPISDDLSLVNIEKQNIFTKILNKIKNFFKK